MSHGYTRVPADAFIGFGDTLSAGAWGAIIDLPAQTADDRAAWVEASWIEVQKANLRLGLRLVVGALADDRRDLHDTDERWDSVQRRLHFALAEREASLDPDIVRAAARLRTTLLRGGNTAHTTLSWRDEVDFGRSQLELIEAPQVAADLTTCGLTDRPAELQAATDALSAALEANPALARHLSIRQALRQCAQLFNTTHDALLQRLTDLPDGPPRQRLQALLDPLNQLLDRFQPA